MLDLSIPDFLVRKQSPDQAKRLKRITAHYRTPKLKSPERRKPTLDGEIVTVHLDDELPRIGSGFRRVILVRGRKWLRIEEIATGRRGKLPVNTPLKVVR